MDDEKYDTSKTNEDISSECGFSSLSIAQASLAFFKAHVSQFQTKKRTGSN